MSLITRIAIGALLMVAGGVISLALERQFSLGDRLDVLLAERRAPGSAELTGGPPDDAGLDIEAVYQLLSLIDEPTRRQVLDSETRFADFVRQESINQAVMRAAVENGADQGVAVNGLIERARQTIIAEAYLNQIIHHNLDARYPSDAQVQEFFEQNVGQFRLADRIHIWQVFIPVVDDGVTEKNARALLTQVATDLEAGRIEFADAARKYSKHLQSQLNAGYMGLINVDELLPEIRSTVLALDEGELSAPVRSAEGYHLLRRGERVAGSNLEYATVAARIRQQLRTEAVNNVRDAAVAKIVENYAVAVDEEQLPQWRSDLRRRDWSGALSTAPGFSRAVNVRAVTGTVDKRSQK